MDAPTVLLIDGDRDARAIYSLILRHHGFRVLETASAEAGFEAACAQRPDLIVLEPFVPPVRGRPLAELLRCDPRTTGVPLLLVTAVPMLLEIGPRWGDPRSEFLVKPCQPLQILAEVRRRLEPARSAA